MTETAIPFLVGLALSVAVIVWLFVVIGNMAERRGHSPWPWWIIAVFGSPLGAILLLWLFFDIRENIDFTGEGDHQ